LVQAAPRAAEGDIVNQPTAPTSATLASGFIQSLWGVRYQVEDVGRSADFYTQQLGFTLDHKRPPRQVSNGHLKLILSGPGASGSRPMPNGLRQEPGGWNRVILEVAELPSRIESLTAKGLHFRNDMETGPGGRQILVEDPDGNLIELFEPTRET
jgi:glyoxylase I family protein